MRTVEEAMKRFTPPRIDERVAVAARCAAWRFGPHTRDRNRYFATAQFVDATHITYIP